MSRSLSGDYIVYLVFVILSFFLFGTDHGICYPEAIAAKTASQGTRIVVPTCSNTAKGSGF